MKIVDFLLISILVIVGVLFVIVRVKSSKHNCGLCGQCDENCRLKAKN